MAHGHSLHGFATYAARREILPNLGRSLCYLDADLVRADISGGTFMSIWHAALLLLPSMVASLPPIERLIIHGKHLQLCTVTHPCCAAD